MKLISLILVLQAVALFGMEPVIVPVQGVEANAVSHECVAHEQRTSGLLITHAVLPALQALKDQKSSSEAESSGSNSDAESPVSSASASLASSPDQQGSLPKEINLLPRKILCGLCGEKWTTPEKRRAGCNHALCVTCTPESNQNVCAVCTKQQAEVTCIFCCEEIGEKQEKSTLGCDPTHKFHSICISRWLETCENKQTDDEKLVPSCPMCRADIVWLRGKCSLCKQHLEINDSYRHNDDYQDVYFECTFVDRWPIIGLRSKKIKHQFCDACLFSWLQTCKIQRRAEDYVAQCPCHPGPGLDERDPGGYLSVPLGNIELENDRERVSPRQATRLSRAVLPDTHLSPSERRQRRHRELQQFLVSGATAAYELGSDFVAGVLDLFK